MKTLPRKHPLPIRNSVPFVLLWIVAWAVMFDRLEAAYSYPIGIPAAWADPEMVRPPRPDPWGSEIPGYYYVNNTTGSDTGRKYGTPSAPRKTIPRPLGPGSYCEVNGAYVTSSSGWTYLQGAGTAGPWVANTAGPAWIVGADAKSRASFSAKVLFLGKYLCVEHIDNLAGLKNWQFSTVNATLGYEASYMLVRNCEVVGEAALQVSAVAISSNTAIPTNNIVFYHNKVHGFGPDIPTSTDIDANGVMATGGCKYIWILDNEIYDMSGAGVAVSAVTYGPSTTSRIFVGRNHVYDTWAAGIAAKTSDHVVFSENLIHDIDWTSWSDAKCIGAQYSLESIWILYNHCYNGDLGIKIGSSSGPNPTNVYIIGNVVHDIYDKPEDPSVPTAESGYIGAITAWGGDHRIIVGNTVYNCLVGVSCPAAQPVPLSFVVENNILANCKYRSINVGNGVANTTIHNNLLYQNVGAASIMMSSTAFTTATANALPNVDGLIEADPLFTETGTSPANRVLSIKAMSPAKDAGLADTKLALDVYAAYLADFGVPINVDITRGLRPEGAGWDIGAYEVNAVHDRRVPTPSGLKVIPE